MTQGSSQGILAYQALISHVLSMPAHSGGTIRYSIQPFVGENAFAEFFSKNLCP
jgi:hypothetical protein